MPDARVMDLIPRLNAALTGRYRIERQLGEGGMATVYLAADLRHQRQLALKVLKPELAAIVGAERFLLEITTTAKLQHPNILPLFDSGEIDAFLFYVMPYVRGESLRQRLDREHQLSVGEAVRIATNVAEALDYAHRQCVIHRDIKPANVLLQDGKPVISDFGIALAVSTVGGGRLTETGMSIGTPHYMSPEQAIGDPHVGPPTDIYALGCVLHEMLVGEPPFTGSTPQAVLGRIIGGQRRSICDDRPSVPPNVDAAVARALEKIPADRFASASEFARSLQDPGFAAAPSQTTSKASSRERKVIGVAWPAIAMAASALAVWGWIRPAPKGPVAKTRIALPASQRVVAVAGQSRPLDLSRDGARVVYVGETDDGFGLFVRDLSETNPRWLQGTEGARQPFFSPDARWVGFFAAGELRRLPVAGGAPIAITELPTGETGGGSWGSDGRIVFVVGNSLYSVSEGGGAPELVELAAVGEGLGSTDTAATGRWGWPEHLPDGEHVLLSVPRGTALVSLATGQGRLLLQGRHARFLPPGFLVFYAGEERLRAVRFDPRNLAVRGVEVPALEGVFRGPANGAAAFAVSETGTVVYVAGGFERTLWLVDRDGDEEPIPVPSRGYRFPRVSPLGARMAVIVDPRPSQLWSIDLARGVSEPLTAENHHVDPEWAPGGDRLLVTVLGDLHWMPADGTDVPQRFSERPLAQYQPSWSVDDVVMINETSPGGGLDLIAIEWPGGVARTFLATPEHEALPDFSPDGRWLAYVSSVSGRAEVYVRPYPEGRPRHAVSVDGGTEPRWSADGREIFYRSGNRMVAARVSAGQRFSVLASQPLFETDRYDLSQTNNWDVTPDGRFVFVRSDEQMLRQIRVVQNFHEELDGLIPR